MRKLIFKGHFADGALCCKTYTYGGFGMEVELDEGHLEVWAREKSGRIRISAGSKETCTLEVKRLPAREEEMDEFIERLDEAKELMDLIVRHWERLTDKEGREVEDEEL